MNPTPLCPPECRFVGALLLVVAGTACSDGRGGQPGSHADGSVRADASPNGGGRGGTNGETDAVASRGGDRAVDAGGGSPYDASGSNDAGVLAADGGMALDTGAGDGSVEGGDPLDAPEGCSPFATRVIEHTFGTGQNFGQESFPENLFGPPIGGGCCQGSLDVVSFGNGGSVVVEFANNAIVDGPGVDFLVFENAFFIGGNETNPRAEPGLVAVSEDGETWTEFPCTATAYPYGSCAGWHPTYANPEMNAIDPTDPVVAGGDPFDLADIGVSRARFVRIRDREGDALVFDLDAVAIVNGECE